MFELPFTVCNRYMPYCSSWNPATKFPKLLAKYSRPNTGSVKLIAITPLSDYHKYLTICAELLAKIEEDDDDEPEDSLEFATW